jgi:hypothetical protein
MKFVPEGTDKSQVLSFLSDANQDRGGVVVAFNRNILQGPYVTYATDPAGDIIHNDPELAMRVPEGYVNLAGAVVAAESLGGYEDEVLENLGLI